MGYSLADPVDVAQIIHLFENGIPVACASESVWGISCDYDNKYAVQRIVQRKQRQADKGLILVTGNRKHLDFLVVHLPQKLQTRIDNYWPGFTTLLIPDICARIPPWIKGRFNSVAVRLTSHKELKQLSALRGMVVSTSANLHGQPAARSYEEIINTFPDIAVIKSAVGSQKKPSPIIDLHSGDVIR